MAQCSHGLVRFRDSVLDVEVVGKVKGDVGSQVSEMGGEVDKSAVLVDF